MTEVKWIVDSTLKEKFKEDNSPYPYLDEVLEEQGIEYITTNVMELLEGKQLPWWNNECVVVHGAIKFNRFIKENYAIPYRWCPGHYFNREKVDYMSASAHMNEYMLNKDFIILPWGAYKYHIQNKNTDLYKNFLNRDLFLKPEGSIKLFTGFVSTQEDADIDIKVTDQFYNMMPEQAIVISPAKTILNEYRFFIGNREIIAQSNYNWDEQADIIEVSSSSIELVEKIIKLDWQPDLVYTLDIADTPDGPKIVEYNTFSTSGIYHHNTYDIVNKVSEIALREYAGELSN